MQLRKVITNLCGTILPHWFFFFFSLVGHRTYTRHCHILLLLIGINKFPRICVGVLYTWGTLPLAADCFFLILYGRNLCNLNTCKLSLGLLVGLYGNCHSIFGLCLDMKNSDHNLSPTLCLFSFLSHIS